MSFQNWIYFHLDVFTGSVPLGFLPIGQKRNGNFYAKIYINISTQIFLELITCRFFVTEVLNRLDIRTHILAVTKKINLSIFLADGI